MFDYTVQERVDLFVEVRSVQAGRLPACEGCNPLQHAASNEVLLAGC